MFPRTLTIFTFAAVSFATHAAVTEMSLAQDAWQEVSVPDVWRKPPSGVGGYSWYRCAVHIPAAWKERKLSLFSEPVDDAREVYLNGTRIGGAGAFPPSFRSGLGGEARHPVDPANVKFGQLNTLAIRVYSSDARTGFNVAAPAIFAGDQAMRLNGTWQFQGGDDLKWAHADTTTAFSATTTRDEVLAADVVESILQRLPGEEGPLSVAEALKKFHTPDDLAIDAVLSEPEIGQPLFIDFDERGRMWVLNYKQYPNPAGLTAVSRDKYLRTVFDKVPPPPPNHFPGRDKITIHEDTDGDGKYDKHKTFVDGLSIAVSFARGRGGVFVMNPPYLLFYPDADKDDVPDGDPEVLLEGFGIEDSHSVAANLRWGPDGWIYGSQGSTVTGQIKHYGTDEKPIHSMGQLIWRYHPETRKYEIFAEGGGNTFGVEIDSKGRVYSGHNGGDTRGFHYVQGGYYQKSFGKHGELTNPYAFGYFPAMGHHSVPRFTHTYVIYEGAALSAKYAGKLFGVGPLQSEVVISDVQPKGTTFTTNDIDRAITSDDPWFRPVEIKVGPDGAIYVADFYEQRIDHASHHQGRVTPDTGRIYRLRAPESEPTKPDDYSSLSALELLEILKHENKLHRQIALRLLGDLHDSSIVPTVSKRLFAADGQLALEYLWALNLSGGFNETIAAQTLQHKDPYVRAWTIRLLCDDQQVSESIAQHLDSLANNEPNVEVRCQLACSARRLPAAQAIPIVSRLLKWDEDADDPLNPLLIWWAIEAKADEGREQIVNMMSDPVIWNKELMKRHIAERVMRRYAMAGSRRDLLTCAQLFEAAPSPEAAATLLQGFETAFAGRTLSTLPEELVAALTKVGGGSLALRLRRGDEVALGEALKLVTDEKINNQQRVEVIQVLGQIQQDRVVETLLKTLAITKRAEIQSAILTALQPYDAAEIGIAIAKLHNSLTLDAQQVAQGVLASRATWAGSFLAEVDAGNIKPESVPAAVLQKLLFHKDEQIASLVRKHWGSVQSATTDEMRAEIERIQNVLANTVGNPYRGKQLFLTNCGKCHQLFTDGGQIGPNLTPYKRDDVRGILLNVVNPSLEIREGFENYVVFTADGRTLNGFVEEQDSRVVVLKGADGQRLIIPRDDIEEMAAIRTSIMPEGILKPLDDQQLRDLFAYLRATQPLP
ncbi:MAG: c-type cytochrome [Planctomycetaceae bacterium]|nr:c-type cytochrome [Planctomycetales bacterium]MCB9923544.1 c-type cytochrome [Planctomycetaceae bacterium]